MARHRTIIGLALSSLCCIGLLQGHAVLVGSAELGWLGWNLFLAWIPLSVAMVLSVGSRRRWPALTLAGLFVAWLLFFPNAPYIVTDFIHVGDSSSTVADLVVIALFSANGLALGLASLLLVQRAAARALGASAGWVVSLSAIVLSGVGVYLGRIHRLNSWDALLDPTEPLILVGERVLEPLAHPGFYAGLALYTIGLAALYALVSRRGLLRVDDRL